MRQEIAPHAFLDLLLETELSGREARRVKTSLRLSNLPTGQTLENFDFAFQPAIERSRIDTLATCAWVRTAETVLIQGPPGRRQDASVRGVWASGRSSRASRCSTSALMS